jgi:hypothetical protein
MNEIDLLWERMKHEYPIGHKLYGNVLMVRPFGIFVDLGYTIFDGCQFSGIVDIGTKDDDDSSGLPMDNSLWPVVAYRESSKEICLRLAKW